MVLENNQESTHFAVEVSVFKAVHAILNTLPRGQVNEIVTAFEQSRGVVLKNEGEQVK